VVEYLCKFLRESLYELFVHVGELDVAYFVEVFDAAKMGPGECSSDELDDHVEETPHVVSSSLVLAKVSVGGHVATRANPTRFAAFVSERSIWAHIAP